MCMVSIGHEKRGLAPGAEWPASYMQLVSGGIYCAARKGQTALALPVSTPAWEHDCVSPAPPWALPGTVVAPRSGLTDKREGGRISRCSRFVMGSVG